MSQPHDQSLRLPPTQSAAGTSSGAACRSTLATYAECPLCGGHLFAEHAHFKCASCGWRDSCCD